MRAIRETDGVVLAVTDEEILEAKAAIDGCGVGCEPASAASVAGVRELVGAGLDRRPTQRVVAVLTGHVLKDPGTLLQYHREMRAAAARARTGRSRSRRTLGGGGASAGEVAGNAEPAATASD